MPDDKLLRDLRNHVLNINDVKDWIDKVYYDPAFGTIFTKPLLSFLEQACDFLTDNLLTLARNYAEKKGLNNNAD